MSDGPAADPSFLRIGVTGASGRLGPMLLPRLTRGPATVVICDREESAPAAARINNQATPGLGHSGPETPGEIAARLDLLIHLGDSEALDPGACEGPLGRVVRLRPLGDLSRRPATPDNQGSRTGGARLELYVPTVHDGRVLASDGYPAGSPTVLHRVRHTILAALRPTLSVDTLARYLTDTAPGIGATHVPMSDGQSGNPVYATVMRGVDLTFALVVVLGFWWLLAGLWLAVRLDSPGPGFFRQTRIGRRGSPFTCWKFRTMRQGTRQTGTHELSADVVTRLGRLLRATKLDELPQVFNILRGEIALIGPRPCLPVQNALVEARRRRGVLDLMPGISGLAQVERLDMSDPERLADREADYAALQSIGFDLRLMIATATGKGRGDQVAG